MRYGSVCSGIEAATVAWHGLGWSAAWYSEIEPFPCAVLAHHYPTVPNWGDMTLLPERTGLASWVGDRRWRRYSPATSIGQTDRHDP